jgi:hypothetical protein
MKRQNPEHWICKEFMTWVRLNMRRYPCLELLFHIPNEGKRNPQIAAEIGIRAGVPDYCMPVSSLEYRGFWLEIKAPKKKPTKQQLWWLERLRASGHWAEWTDDLQQAIFWADWYCGRVRYGQKKS